MDKPNFIIHHFFGYCIAGQEDCSRKTSVNGSDNLEISCWGGTEPFCARSRLLVSHTACLLSASSEGFCLASCRTIQGWTSQSQSGSRPGEKGSASTGRWVGKGRASPGIGSGTAPGAFRGKPSCCLPGVSINQTIDRPALLFIFTDSAIQKALFWEKK